ncbi:T9SS-dependent M36 family metallopeptidase [Hymenobacter sp. HSC-4F20]|uniref:T9SS-dependent M36 family metallopeptidase n=1 Tax=Hymenobacter sp. HSC-4F20 TaxID=2864135 RepID=UPI001C72B999|nr:T9SS-dependent M36 family metallopeptidase [Hymenobacter sp. HSC-4F20]MBX0291380.1 T9SS-dependent M36 family metallopeptidase [Hymenobacter sp. HSC-4F20]
MKSTFTPTARALTAAVFLAVPGLAAAQSTALLDQARAALQARTTALGLKKADVADPTITTSFTDAHNGITHVYLRQRYQGVEIYNAVADVHLNANGGVASLHSSFVANTAAQARPATPGLTAEQAVAAAARALNLPTPQGLKVEKAGTPAAGIEFSRAGISLETIPVKLMYLPLPSGELRLVWDVLIYPTHAQNCWSVRVDAATGALLDQQDLVISEQFSMAPLTAPLAAVTTPTPAAPTAARPTAGNSYNVWPITVESPNHGSRQVVTDPADPAVSPYGWHDVDGKPGADSLRTAGNNVYAYEDRNNRNNNTTELWRGGYAPKGGTNQIFDAPFTSALPTAATSNLDAAIINLFYWNNLMHDVMARKGFNEASGNFQATNYTGAGKGGDAVFAEAQDASAATSVSLNNANFSTLAEGRNPRMQMYLWDQTINSASITAPANLAGSITIAEGVFTRRLSKTGPINGNLVLVNDGTATPTYGCAAYSNATAVKDNIALVDRGDCTFVIKVQQAQAAGAKMVVIINNNATQGAVSFGGTADTVGIRIPGVMISKADGDRIKAVLQAGTPVSFSASGVTYYRDGDFDNGIIAHEYGHGISSRLTGGAAAPNCLRSAEQMGEGWSDFFGLWMTTKPGDVGATGRGIGTYAKFQATTGPGIRPNPYSTNLTVNPATYDYIGKTVSGVSYAVTDGTVPVHNVGYVWASALWDLNWALIDKYGYNTDLRGTTGGNNIALQLVIDGLKLQACNPGFIDGRNAILKADSLNNNAANSAIIWRVFARRGLGFSARQGSANSLTDQTAAFDMPAVLSSRPQLSEKLLEVYPNPARTQVLVRTQLSSAAPVQVEVVSLLGQRVRTQQVSAGRLQQEGVAIDVADLAGGVYVVRLTTSEGTITKKVVVQH